MEVIVIDPLEVGRKEFATFIAMVVRNAMEDFHTKHLSDEQMKELNPIIRNAIYTAMYAFENKNDIPKAGRFFDYHMSMVPKHWEQPELTVDFGEQPKKFSESEVNDLYRIFENKKK
jgi:hypothetical protein